MDTFKKIFRSPLVFIHTQGRKLLGGRGLRRIPFIEWGYRTLSSLVKQDRVYAHGYTLFVDTTEGIYPVSGMFEKDTTGVFMDQIKLGQTVFDIGADVGYYTCLAAKLVGPTGKVFCFEPNRKSATLIEKSLAINGFSQATLIRAAVSDINGESAIFEHGPHTSVGYDRFQDAKPSAQVKMITLDTFFPEKISVDFMKIDAEGSEGKIIRGMRRILADNPRVTIVVEFYPKLLRMAGDDPAIFLSELQGLGFRFYDINDPLPRKPAAKETILEKYADFTTNLFCVRV